MNISDSINKSIDHVFRHEYAKLVAFLSTKFGVANIDLIEDAVQESLYKAMQIWPFKEIPNDPGKWLYKVASNKLIDELRRNAKVNREYDPSFDNIMADEIDISSEIFADEQLKMMFACCHPMLREIDQIILCLKLLCGFSNKEIGRVLLKNEEAMKKAATRAKQKFRSTIGHLEIPAVEELTDRVDSVLKVIYLLFTNGYTASEGDQVLKKEVCQEAIGLAELLYAKRDFNLPEVRALLSLMYFNIARFDSRADANGNIVTMEYQNRSLWDQNQIEKGLQFFYLSAEGQSISKYHFESAIAREYVIADSFLNIDWEAIVEYHEYLNALFPNPISELNMLVALAYTKGVALAFSRLKKLDAAFFSNNHLYFAIKADFEKKLGLPSYVSTLKHAIKMTSNQKEKELLISKI